MKDSGFGTSREAIVASYAKESRLCWTPLRLSFTLLWRNKKKGVHNFVDEKIYGK